MSVLLSIRVLAVILMNYMFVFFFLPKLLVLRYAPWEDILVYGCNQLFPILCSPN